VFEGTKTLNHSYSSKVGTERTYRFFLTCLLSLCPTRVQTSALEGIERMSCRCFAPLFMHFNKFDCIGMLINDPESIGLFETTFNLSY